MPKDFNRIERFNRLLLRELNIIIPNFGLEVDFATVQYVRISADMAHANIYINYLDINYLDINYLDINYSQNNCKHDMNFILTTFNGAAKRLRHFLAKKINMRTTPHLHFYADESIIRARATDEALRAIVK